MSESPLAPAFIPPNGGRMCRVVGDSILVKVDGSVTGGAFSLIEETSPTGGGPPLHVHTREDELFTVLEGAVEMRCGDQTIIATAGHSCFFPRDIPHSFRNVGQTPSRVQVFISPAGFERFFYEIEESMGGGPPNLPVLMEMGRKYGLEILV